MKKLIVGSIIVLFFAYGLAAGEFKEAPPSSSTIEIASIEKTHTTEDDPATVTRYENPAQGNSIFSWSTIISLNLVIIGIIAFRRNTYS